MERDFINLCLCGDWKRVRSLLKKCDPNVRFAGLVPLCSAVHNNNIDVVRVLLADSRTEVNKGGLIVSNDMGVIYVGTSLHIACLKGHEEIVKLLLQHPKIEMRLEDQNGRTALELCRSKEVRSVMEEHKKKRGLNVAPQKASEEKKKIKETEKEKVKEPEVKIVVDKPKQDDNKQKSKEKEDDEANRVECPLDEIEVEGEDVEEVTKKEPIEKDKPEEIKEKEESPPPKEKVEAKKEVSDDEEGEIDGNVELSQEMIESFREKQLKFRLQKQIKKKAGKKRISSRMASLGKLFGAPRSRSNSTGYESSLGDYVMKFPAASGQAGDDHEPNGSSSGEDDFNDDKQKIKTMKKRLVERERDVAAKKKLINLLNETIKKKDKVAEGLNEQIKTSQKKIKSKNGDIKFREIEIKTLKEELGREKTLHRSLIKEIQRGRMKIFRVDDREIERGEKIGEGAFGKVYTARWSITRDIAIKEVKLIDTTRKEILQEFQDQVSLVHSNILRVYGYSDPPGIPGERSVRILMEKMDTDLRKYLFKMKPTIAVKFDIMRQMVNGLHYMHTRDPTLLHRDIKSLNFLISGEYPSLQIKITDFGLMKTMQSSSTFVQSTKQQGTINWMAPELLQRNPQYSVFSDIYALGITFFETLFEKFPYQGMNQQVVYDEVKNQGMRPDISDPKLPKQFRPFLENLWKKDPRERLTSKKILEWMDKHEKKIKKKYGKNRFPPDKK